jgi:hypothetical protein
MRAGSAGRRCWSAAPRDGAQNCAARDRDQQDEGRPAPPPGPELVDHEDQHYPHRLHPPRASPA